MGEDTHNLPALYDDQANLPALSHEQGVVALPEAAGEVDMPEWASRADAEVWQMPGVFLGVKVGEDGWGAGAVDQSTTPVLEHGFVFGVKQQSAGGTGIFTQALPGYRVESLVTDHDTPFQMWRKEREPGGEIEVTHDRGDIGRTHLDPNLAREITAFAETNPAEAARALSDPGNPGLRAGIIRVTGPDGATKHYALGAMFRGGADHWNVQGAVKEIVPYEPPAELTAGQQALPQHPHQPEITSGQ